MKRILAALLCWYLIFIPVFPSVFAEDETVYATREMTISSFAERLDISEGESSSDVLALYTDYKDITPKYSKSMANAVSHGLIEGYADNTLRPLEFITRTEALVILHRALSGINFYKTAEPQFSDIPDWAEKEISDLAGYGIVSGYGNGTYGADDFITEEQVEILLSRLPERKGPTADYYTYVNGNWLNTEKIPDGYPAWSDFDKNTREVLDKTADVIVELAAEQKYGNEFKPGSNEQKIIDVFLSASDEKNRNLIGTAPIKPLLSEIDNAATLRDVMNLTAKMGISGIPNLISFSVNPDLTDAKKYAVYLENCYTGLSVDMIKSGNFEEILSEYEKYITELAKAADVLMSPDEIAEVTEFCRELAAASLCTEEFRSPKELYHPYTADDMEKALGGMDFANYIGLWSLQNAEYTVVLDEGMLRAIGGYLKNENLPLLKNYLKVCVLDFSSQYLTTEMFDIRQKFSNKINGTDAKYRARDMAIYITSMLMETEIADIYIKKNFSEDLKRYAEEMANDILTAFDKRIRNNPWLQEPTKNAAIEKLNNILVQVGYPEYIKGYVNELYQVRGIREGGNILEYIADKSRLGYSIDAYLINENAEVSRDDWIISPLDVNAAYSPQQNSITIPAGIITEPFFDKNASYGKNLGALGSIIAHEITHAFDSTGAQFDKDGNVADWWTDDDKKAFEDICSRVIEYYETFSIGGNNVNGKLTLGENIADLGAMSCIVDIAKEKNCDMEEMFESYAQMWRIKLTPEYEKLLLSVDTHAPNKVRVNAVLSNTPEFSEYYHLVNGDGMYLPPEKQIVIW